LGCDSRPFSLSPPPRHPWNRSGECHIVERVIKKSSVSIVYPTLTQTNYTKWSLIMKVNLQAAGLWDVIESGAGDYRDDRTMLAAIFREVPLEMQAGLAVKSMAHDAWVAIKKVCIDANRIKEANAERLRWEFSDITFKTGEFVEDFLLGLSGVASELRVLVDDVSDKEVIKRLLHAVLNKLE
jgi:hypothetical protein